MTWSRSPSARRVRGVLCRRCWSSKTQAVEVCDPKQGWTVCALAAAAGITDIGTQLWEDPLQKKCKKY
jgi:hypothetical protein